MGYDIFALDKNGRRIDDGRVTSGDHSYFRANVWGMGTLREVMAARGLFLHKQQQVASPEWPAPPEPSECSGDHFDEFNDHLEDSNCEKYAAYEEARRQVLSRGTGVPGTVSWFKFCSNDYWIVTPEEAKTIAEKLDGWKCPEGILDQETLADIARNPEYAKNLERFVWEFAQFNHACSERGGYEVG